MTVAVDVDRVLSEVKNAARIALASPWRRGSLLVLPPKGDVLVTGDLHGDLAAFDRIIQIADLASLPDRHLVLQELVHGGGAGFQDAPDVSAVLIEKVARLMNRFPRRVHLLMGNHEMAELTGRVIMKDGVVLNELFHQGALARYGARVEEAVSYLRGLWRALPLAVRTPTRVFISHSTPSRRYLHNFDAGVLDRPLHEADFERSGSAYALLWGRDFAPDVAERAAASLAADVLVVGHTPCPEGFLLPNGIHIVLDSQGPCGTCLTVPLERPLTCEELAGRIMPVWR